MPYGVCFQTFTQRGLSSGGRAACLSSFGWSQRQGLQIALWAVTLIWAQWASAAGVVWEQSSGYRSFRFADRRSKAEPIRVGFSAMSAVATGIGFTNSLSLEQATRNRILYNGSGVAAGDVDGDGWCDLYFCRLDGANVLYRNRGGWQFSDITAESGVACEGQFSTGACFADLDGDGDLDLLVSSIGGGMRSFRNDGHGHFQETTADSGLLRRYGSHSLALADIDGDGDLDLYVANYRTTTVKDGDIQRFGLKREGGRLIVPPEHSERFRILKNGTEISAVEIGEPDTLYRNDGSGKFTEVSWTDGSFVDEQGNPLPEPPRDWGLLAMFRDLNGDGAPDLYVCNDFFSPDRVWLNDGHGKFRSSPPLTLRKTCLSSMAVDVADINRDGLDDLFVVDMLSRSFVDRQTERSNYENALLPWWGWPLDAKAVDSRHQIMRNTLFLNRGDGTYAEMAQMAGVEASGWSWGCTFLDVDLDGYEDILIPNGHGQNAVDSDFLRTRGKREREREAAGAPPEAWPRLETPQVAFRNRGDLTFEEMAHAWGFDLVGVANGMALADLDNDGDLDVVLNRLNQPAAVLRNNATAPRISIRLKGRPGNTQGIGSRISVRGHRVVQSQSVIAGGRYLSGDDPKRVFAAGDGVSTLSIEIAWRSGRMSRITNAAADTEYEISEPQGEVSPPSSTVPRGLTWFEDVSQLLRHRHEDPEFDDYERQPLLPRKYSQAGPGVAWMDLNGDGLLDPIIGSGRGGNLGVLLANGRGGFGAVKAPAFREPLSDDALGIAGWSMGESGSRLLVSVTSYETGLSNHSPLLDFALRAQGPARLPEWGSAQSSGGCLAMGDLDGDGDLDLFQGGACQPGRYPEAIPSLVYRHSNGVFSRDDKNSETLANVGLVNGAVFSDLDGDGLPELILACEWGPVRVFRNQGGRLTEITRELGLERFQGWWNGVTTGDIDGDGRLDIVASNWGRNSKYQSVLPNQLKIYGADVDGNGTWDIIESAFEPSLGREAPLRDFKTLAQSMPFLRESFTTYRGFAAAGVREIFGERLTSADAHSVTWLDSTLFLNRGTNFIAVSLPLEAQLAPAFAVCVGDADGDGAEDVFLSQNFFAVDRETGRYDAGRGVWLRGDGKGSLEAIPASVSGVDMPGDQRGASLGDYDGDGRLDLLVGQNGAASRLWHNRTAKPGLRVTLQGTQANRDGFGSQMRWIQGGHQGPVHELHCGSGYLSSESPVVVLGCPAGALQLWVRWPGGKLSISDVPAGNRSVTVKHP